MDIFTPFVQLGIWVFEATDYVIDKFVSNFLDPYTDNVKNVNCQDLYISEQFDSGARYFDFRVGNQ